MKRHWTYELDEYSKTYGPIFTLWFGTRSHIIIRDFEIAQKLMKKRHLSGRPFQIMSNI